MVNTAISSIRWFFAIAQSILQCWLQGPFCLPSVPVFREGLRRVSWGRASSALPTSEHTFFRAVLTKPLLNICFTGCYLRVFGASVSLASCLHVDLDENDSSGSSMEEAQTWLAQTWAQIKLSDIREWMGYWVTHLLGYDLYCRRSYFLSTSRKTANCFKNITGYDLNYTFNCDKHRTSKEHHNLATSRPCQCVLHRWSP